MFLVPFEKSVAILYFAQIYALTTLHLSRSIAGMGGHKGKARNQTAIATPSGIFPDIPQMI